MSGMATRSASRNDQGGFTLIEMIVVTFLLALAMLGILAVFDTSARINKNEQQLADAQGSVRYGIYQMTRAIRMAGSGGLFVTQAVLNHNDPQLAGITVTNSVEPNSYDNVETGTTVTGLAAGETHPVRPGTDMIEVRGVINSPLVGFDETNQAGGNGCGTCTASQALDVKPIAGSALLGQHYNDDPARPQFAAIDAYTATAATNPMFVIVSQNDDLHNGCSQPSPTNPTPAPVYPQPTYNVGLLSTATTLSGGGNTFGNVNFGNAAAQEFNNEFPSAAGTSAVALTSWLRHAGILDDLIFFIDNSEPNHPALAQGTRRGTKFDVVTLADDVEDMQVAYGVDTNNDEIVGRLVTAPPNPPTDPDTNVSNVAGKDEWVPNVSGADNPVTGTSAVYQATNFVANSAGPLSGHCVRLHGVMVSLVARSKDSDPTYKGPTATGYKVMNSAQVPTAGQYRRRVQTLKINLRNYAFQG
jgi:prepilin-type N-terminal cleavage/methylation domain-containing protein